MNTGRIIYLMADSFAGNCVSGLLSTVRYDKNMAPFPNCFESTM
jgi:hypothetical protein